LRFPVVDVPSLLLTLKVVIAFQLVSQIELVKIFAGLRPAGSRRAMLRTPGCPPMLLPAFAITLSLVVEGE
jgi:hypothetical protein